MPTLLAVDGPSSWFRAFYGVPDTVTAPDGTPVNAARGFLDALARHIGEHRPDQVVIADDFDWRPAWRVDLVPSYKAHRVAEDGGDGTPDPLTPQVTIIVEVLAALGIAYLGVDGFEADDVLGTLAATGPDTVLVVTGDRDLFQLVQDAPRRVRIIYSVDRGRVVGPAEVAEKYAIPGDAYADFALMRGDSSDGLPGVPGVGDKTAAALLNRFGSIEGIRDALATGGSDGFPAGSRAKLLAAMDYLNAAEPVVRVVTDLDLPPHDPALPTEPRDPAALLALAERWGLESSVERMLAVLPRPRAE